MRYKKPKPDIARPVIISAPQDPPEFGDAYQLCARCGYSLVSGAVCEVVSRLPEWLIYSHPRGSAVCNFGQDKAVRGWLAVHNFLDELERERSNKVGSHDLPESWRIPTVVNVDGLFLPFVSLLDRPLIEAALKLVSYDFSGETPTAAEDIRKILVASAQREIGGGRQTKIVPVEFAGEEDAVRWKKVSYHISRNHVEDAWVSALGNMEGALSHAALELIERRSDPRRKYCSCSVIYRHRPVGLDPFPWRGFVEINSSKVREVVIHDTSRKDKKFPRSPGQVLTHDLATEEPVEYALYSKHKVVRWKPPGNRSKQWLDDFQATQIERPFIVSWPELYSWSDWIPRRRPLPLPFSSKTHPDRYNWEKPPPHRSAAVKESNGKPRVRRFGMVATLKPSYRAQAERNLLFGTENRKGKEIVSPTNRKPGVTSVDHQDTAIDAGACRPALVTDDTRRSS